MERLKANIEQGAVFKEGNATVGDKPSKTSSATASDGMWMQ